ncbi:MAG: UDP-N-acetylglucosamine diphosphorylase/glucosamine-1-phosphate N-acetyltransferase [Gammaproteobacteria bacterium]|nr:UDP-N-acetylglucosamine diphosphorylase/glucosamine-1-phosphate N-acetyltransferase [Gammaproteobacteria bacterium]
MGLEVVILAAGQGTRMRSDLPKVLHTLGGRPLLEHVLSRAQDLDADAIHVVYGHGGEKVRGAFKGCDLRWVLQEKQLGTGHALLQVIPDIQDGTTVLVLYGDVPLIRTDTLRVMVDAAQDGDLALLTATFTDPGGYGRIVRDDMAKISRIVEHKDANDAERAITEINTGFLAVSAGLLRSWLEQLSRDNAQGEYYLTDVIGMAVADGITIVDSQPQDEWEVLGINSCAELAQLERKHQSEQAQALMAQGVTLRDPSRFDLRGELSVGRDVVIDINVILEGKVSLGDRVHIGANVVIRNSTMGDDVTIKENCVIEEARVARGCQVGPFARLRPGTDLANDVHVGNFVEIKKSSVARGSKVNHLSYIGDSKIGSGVNIGAGTITCNYDGAYKHQTIIGDDVFVGSATQLVAPVTVGDGATIGAGATITNNVPAGELTLSRVKQKTIPGWKRPVKKP